MRSRKPTLLLELPSSLKPNDDDETRTGALSSSSSSGDKGVRGKRGGKNPRLKSGQSLALQTSFLQSETEELIDELAALGFDVPTEFVATHSPDRIRQAIARAKSVPEVKSLPGLIRYLVNKPGPIPAPSLSLSLSQSLSDKYIRGKYGHLVRR